MIIFQSFLGYGGLSVANAAHQLAEILERLRDTAPGVPVNIITAVSLEYNMERTDMLVHMASLAHRTDEMFRELYKAGRPVNHLVDARTSWLEAPFLGDVGWTRTGMNISPDAIIMHYDLAALEGFAVQYDLTSALPKLNQAVLNSFIRELKPIAEFVRSLAISDEVKTLILTKIESVKMLLEEDGVGFDVILSKLGEIIGLLVILAGSNALDDEDEAKLWEKVKNFSAKFAQDVTVNVFSGAIVAGGMGMIGG